MPQVFISYAHVSPDQELATKLRRFIEPNGFDVFDDSKIRVGQNWAEQIEVQLHNSTHFVALLSAASIKSDMVRREIAIAYKLYKAGLLAILPVRLGLSKELPYELAAYLDLIQHTTWHPEESFDPVCRTIVDAIRGPSATGLLPKSPNPRIFTEPALEAVKSHLARHLGPVARLVVDRAVKKSANWEQLYDLLASEIPVGEERRKFQATRPR